MATPVIPTENTPGWTGSGDRTEPASGLKSSGVSDTTAYAASLFNWMWYSTSQWLTYLQNALPGTYVETSAEVNMVHFMAGGSVPAVLDFDALQDGDVLYGSGIGSSVAYIDLGTMFQTESSATTGSIYYRELRTIRLYIDKAGGGNLVYAVEYRDIDSSGGWSTLASAIYTGTGTGITVSTLAPNADMDFDYTSPRVYRLSIAWQTSDVVVVYGIELNYRASSIIV